MSKPESEAGQPERSPDSIFTWVADFDNPVAVKAASGGPKAPRGKALPIAVASGSAFVLVATVIAALMRPFEAESGISTGGGIAVVPDSPSTSTSTAEPENPEPVDQFELLPETCDGLYGSAMLREFERESMQLNLVWNGARDATPGSTDADLIALMGASQTLDCYWLDETGGTEAAVLTVASEPGVATTDQVAARLVALGFLQQRDRGGVRYYLETRDRGETRGESHFLRDGVWLATNWYGFGPWGYTGHMAENVFY